MQASAFASYPARFVPLSRRVYLASRYGRRRQLRAYAGDLRKLGYTIASDWIYSEVESDGDTAPADHQNAAVADLEAILGADYVIIFTDNPQAGCPATGGHHVEMGYALALGKPVLVVGPATNVFHALPEVMQFHDWRACLAWLAGAPIEVGCGRA